MSQTNKSLVGIGIYSISEAAALTGTPTAAIRRWTSGYTYSRADSVRTSPPVWKSDIGDVDGKPALSFLDLMEIRFIRAFRHHQVSWGAIRKAAEIAAEMFNDNHPFTRRRFQTDGRRIFAQIEADASVKLFDLNRKSWVFKEIIDPSLYRGVDFAADQVVRWFPMFPKRAIVLDPTRSFGRPLVKEGVPTDVLNAALEAAGGDVSATARWHDVSQASVRAAAAFERKLVKQPKTMRAAAA